MPAAVYFGCELSDTARTFTSAERRTSHRWPPREHIVLRLGAAVRCRECRSARLHIYTAGSSQKGIANDRIPSPPDRSSRRLVLRGSLHSSGLDTGPRGDSTGTGASHNYKAAHLHATATPQTSATASRTGIRMNADTLDIFGQSDAEYTLSSPARKRNRKQHRGKPETSKRALQPLASSAQARFSGLPGAE